MERAEKRILVVDDDESIRTLLFTILSRSGLCVDAAIDGAEALDRLAQCRYALILLDLMMPRINGWQVLEAIAKRPGGDRPMVIVMTAGTELRDLSPELVACSVRKPFDLELLLDAVIACLTTVGERSQLPDCPDPESATGDLHWHKS